MRKSLVFMMLIVLLTVTIMAGCSGGSGNDEGNVRNDNASTHEQNTAAPAEEKSEEPAKDRGGVVTREPMPPQVSGDEVDDMYFDYAGTNPFVATEDDALSTFAVDVDTGAYTIVRNYIRRGVVPPEDAPRVEEFINYFTMDYAPPKKEAFAIHVDGGASPFGKGYQLIRVALKGKEIKESKRKAATLIFVVDVSGSMEREGRLELVKKSLRLLVNELGDQDRVGIVTYGTDARIALQPTTVEEKGEILDTIDAMTPGGSTNAAEGLRFGYKLASEFAMKDRITRVILCSDGVANVGETTANGILADAKEYADKEGIFLTTVGVGMGNYNDTLLEQLADKGNGNYAYVDTFAEARRIFQEQLSGTLQTIASDVKVQVEFDPNNVERYRLLGYENRELRDRDFRDDRVDAGEVGSGHTVTALYEVKVAKGANGPLGKVKLRYEDEERKEIMELSKPIGASLSMGNDVKFLAAVAEYAEILRGSYFARESNLNDVLKLAEETARGEQQQEFVGIVRDTIAVWRSLEQE